MESRYTQDCPIKIYTKVCFCQLYYGTLIIYSNIYISPCITDPLLLFSAKRNKFNIPSHQACETYRPMIRTSNNNMCCTVVRLAIFVVFQFKYSKIIDVYECIQPQVVKVTVHYKPRAWTVKCKISIVLNFNQKIWIDSYHSPSDVFSSVSEILQVNKAV